MNESDKQFLKEFLFGFGGASVVFIALCMILALTIWASGSNTETDNSQSTKVVGTYKECDIIQWHYGPLAEYKYFLYCPNEREI